MQEKADEKKWACIKLLLILCQNKKGARTKLVDNFKLEKKWSRKKLAYCVKTTKLARRKHVNS